MKTTTSLILCLLFLGLLACGGLSESEGELNPSFPRLPPNRGGWVVGQDLWPPSEMIEYLRCSNERGELELRITTRTIEAKTSHFRVDILGEYQEELIGFRYQYRGLPLIALYEAEDELASSWRLVGSIWPEDEAASVWIWADPQGEKSFKTWSDCQIEDLDPD